MEFKRGTYFKNGCAIKHTTNRSVSVFSQKKDGVVIVFKRADLTWQELRNNPSLWRIKKGKVGELSVGTSHEAALALYYCLQDYFARVLPDEQKEKFGIKIKS